MPVVMINGAAQAFTEGERLIDLLNRCGATLPQVCYHPQLGPIQTCDTCMVKADGRLVRACGTEAVEGMKVVTESAQAQKAQREAFDRILGNHLLYCTVCDNNNGNCTVHNTTKLLAVEQQQIPYSPKPYAADFTNPFYRYDPDQCILCGRCVEACQNLQVNETLSIRWEDERPRALRNAIILGRMMGKMNPDLMECFAAAVGETLGSERPLVIELPGLFSLLGQFRRPELRRSVALINRFLESLERA
jgi:formate dehydrogenase major subunit